MIATCDVPIEWLALGMSILALMITVACALFTVYSPKEPELMLKMADHMCADIIELLEVLK